MSLTPGATAPFVRSVQRSAVPLTPAAFGCLRSLRRRVTRSGSPAPLKPPFAWHMIDVPFTPAASDQSSDSLSAYLSQDKHRVRRFIVLRSFSRPLLD